MKILFILIFLTSCATISHKLSEENSNLEIDLVLLQEQENVLNNGFSLDLVKDIYPKEVQEIKNCKTNCINKFKELNFKYWFYITKFVDLELIEQQCPKCTIDEKNTLMLSLERKNIEDKRNQINERISQNNVVIEQDRSDAIRQQVVFISSALLIIGSAISAQGRNNNYQGDSGLCRGDDVYVNSYVRSDGTFVQAHCRSRADRNCYNNYSSENNINPYTGKIGTIDCP